MNLTNKDIDWGVDAAAREEAREAARAIQIAEEMERERVKREARQRLDAEERGPVTLPEIVTLRERLARPRTVSENRIEVLAAAGLSHHAGRAI